MLHLLWTFLRPPFKQKAGKWVTYGGSAWNRLSECLQYDRIICSGGCLTGTGCWSRDVGFPLTWEPILPYLLSCIGRSPSRDVDLDFRSGHQTHSHRLSTTRNPTPIHLNFIDGKSVNDVQMCCLGTIVLNTVTYLIRQTFGRLKDMISHKMLINVDAAKDLRTPINRPLNMFPSPWVEEKHTFVGIRVPIPQD